MEKCSAQEKGCPWCGAGKQIGHCPELTFTADGHGDAADAIQRGEQQDIANNNVGWIGKPGEFSHKHEHKHGEERKTQFVGRVIERGTPCKE